MDFNSKPIVLQTFFTDKKYIIPRYQREYSWSKEQLEDFYSDIVSNIKEEEKGIYKTQEYFFGTVILVGDMEKPNKPIEIIDGQQRITTITIFLSVLSDILYNYDDNLSTLLWKYIIAQDNDGNFYSKHAEIRKYLKSLGNTVVEDYTGDYSELKKWYIGF